MRAGALVMGIGHSKDSPGRMMMPTSRKAGEPKGSSGVTANETMTHSRGSKQASKEAGGGLG